MIEQLPRVWVGESVVENSVAWIWCFGSWDVSDLLVSGNVFMVQLTRPTIDPSEMDTIATCKVVDW